MPLISVETLAASSNTRLALWHLTETVGELCECSSLSAAELECLFSTCKSPSRQKEILAVRAILDSLFGASVTLSHDGNGRPLLANGYNVSISHTRGWVAVIVSRYRGVAIDVEYLSPRVLKIKDRFLRTDETADTVATAMLHWCTKETLYKLFSADRLEFTQMRVRHINTTKGNDEGCFSGTIVAENLLSMVTVTVHYRVTTDYVLTYCF